MNLCKLLRLRVCLCMREREREKERELERERERFHIIQPFLSIIFKINVMPKI